INTFRRHLRQYPSPEGVKLLRAAVQHARQITQKIREDRWLEWCATFNAHTSLSEIWSKLRIATGKLPRAPAHPQPLQEANRLAEHFAERSSPAQLYPEIRLHLQQVQLEREKTWLLCPADAVNRLKLKDTILSKGPDTMSPDYSTPALWESSPAVFNILQTGTRKADCNMKALTPHNGSVEPTSTKAGAAFTIEGDGCSTLQVELAAILGALRHASINSEQGV
ncbi:putative pol-like 30, partial [Homarus americanus]